MHAIARLNVGGAALSVLELAAGQQAQGDDVVVVAGSIPAGEDSMEHLADELGVEYLRLPALRRELAVWADLTAVHGIRALLRSRRPTVLHTHTSKAGTTGRVAALLSVRGRPRTVVHSFHGHVLSGYFDPRRERVFRGIERALAHATDALIAVSEEVRDDLVRLRIAPIEKFVVVPYGFDLDRRVDTSPAARQAARDQIGAGADDFVVGWAGRLTEIKRPGDLVRTVAALDGARLVLAGDGSLRAEVVALARDLGVTDRVHLLGYVRDIGAWYGAFDAFLLTSANEGTPVVAIESLAAGVPVVGTDAGGTRTVVDEGETGFLLPVGDVANLAEALGRLRDDTELRARLGAAGRARMRERFSTERMVADVTGVYERAAVR
jgi:glycosyltransferase involved in cell wall biosynthesis